MADEKRPARIAGYSILITAVLIFGSALALILNYFIAPNKTITVFFPKIGELKVEQPFMYQGMQVGAITACKENVYSGVSVTIALSRNIKIREGAQIYCSDVGLFGTKREIVLINGPESAPPVKDLQNLRGTYYIGMTEVISSIGSLQEAMTIISTAFENHLAGDTKAIKLLSFIEKVSEDSDSINRKLQGINDFISIKIPEGVSVLSETAEQGKVLESKIHDKIPELRKDLERLISASEKVVSAIPSMIDKAEKAAEKAESIDRKTELSSVIKELKSMQKRFDMIRTTAHRLLLILRKYE